MKLWSIGYEGRTPEEFLDLLRKAGVTLVCDVRRNAISRKRGFSKGTLRRVLEAAGLRYEHLPELGIASARRKNLTPAAKEKLFAEYARVDLPKLAKPLARIAAWAKEGERIALLCFERDPADCHRSRITLGTKGTVRFVPL